MEHPPALVVLRRGQVYLLANKQRLELVDYRAEHLNHRVKITRYLSNWTGRRLIDGGQTNAVAAHWSFSGAARTHSLKTMLLALLFRVGPH